MPGRLTSSVSLRENNIVPGQSFVPKPRYQSAPFNKMRGTLASVSTLLTDVGLPNRPTVTGNGGFCRGSGFLPSITSSTAVSSPAT
jgi:hypothetical protein